MLKCLVSERRRVAALVCCLLFAVSSVGLVLAQAPVTYPELAEGDALMASRKWKEAEDWYYDFIKANPRHATALLRIALVELRQPGGDEVKAKGYLDRVIDIENDNPIALFLLGKSFEAMDEQKKADGYYDRLITMGPGRNDPTRAGAVHLARFNRGLSAALEGDNEKAKDLLGQVLQREPQQTYATYELGLVAVDEGNNDKAIEWLQKAVRNTTLWAPREAWPYPQSRYGYVIENSKFELARALLAKGDAKQAAELLKPLYERAQRATKAKRGQGRPKAKAPLEGKADTRYKNAPFYYAEALVAAGNAKEAKKVFKQFARMSAGDSALKSEARARAKKL